MYPYSVCMLLCTMFVDYLCTLGVNSMYAYNTGLSLLGEWWEFPPLAENLLIPHHIKKFPQWTPLPNFYAPPLSTKSQFPPLNNNFQVNSIKASLLAGAITPFTFLF